MNNDTVRIDKYLANLGYQSRRKIEDFLKLHKVEINGRRVNLVGERFDPLTDNLTIDGQEFRKEDKVYYLLNKPKGYVSSVSDEASHPSVLKLIREKQVRLYPVGRLDVESRGLVLLTNDGELTYKLTHPKFQIPKTYKALIVGRLNHKQLTLLRQGVRLKDGKTAPAQVKIARKTESNTTILITIFEGRNRQIRRMCRALNLNLLDLERIEFANLKLDGLDEGDYRELTSNELKTLRTFTAHN